MRFIGTIDAKVDSKGRVFLPATFRRLLQQNASGESQGEATEGIQDVKLIMRKDIFENCLVIYPEDVWYERMDAMKQRLSVWKRADQALLRKFVTDAEWLGLDSNGRLLIPKRYLKMAEIEGEVTFVGMDGTIEIWSKKKLEEMQSDEQFALNIEEMMSEQPPQPSGDTK